MRPIDLFMEKETTRDTRSDNISRSLLHDAMTLAMVNMINERQGIHPAAAPVRMIDGKDPRTMTPQELEAYRNDQAGQRDKMALASMIFCSPLMLLGMGASLAFMDNMKLNEEGKLSKGLNNRMQLRAAGSLQDALAKEQSLTRTLSTSMEPLGFRSILDRREPERKRTLLSEPPRVARVVPDPNRSWIKASKVVKEKQKLSDELEKQRGQLSLADVSAVHSRMEQLDKQLIKLGC
jgi:hypothetical protein